jgi:hypothetical protein
VSVNGFTGAVSLTTSNISEGSNLYYTDVRARTSISGSTGISYNSTSGVITNSAPDQTVSLTASTGISTTGTYPSFTITNTAPDQTVALTSGTGISATGTYPNFTITNTAPDQTVALTQGGTTTITGTYPNFTISSADQYVGTVTSIGITESVAALSITGSPVTTSGNINIGFAGSPTQYVAGDGSLVTFPTIVTQAQNLVAEVYNNTGATLTKGTIVYINGGQGNLPTVTKAIATSDPTSAQTFGFINVDLTNNNNGYVTIIGRLENIDTQAYANGTQLYLSGTTAGTYTSTKPQAPIHLVYVAIVVRSHPTQGVLEVKIQNGVEMDEIHDVQITSIANGNILQYSSADSLWHNVAGTTTNIAEGTNLYYTDTRARASISTTATGLTYTSGTGVLSLTAGYVIPTTSSATNWDTAYTNRITSATSPLSITTNVISIAQASTSVSGYLSSTDWTTFNNKASTASLANYLPLAGGTLTGALSGTSAMFTGSGAFGSAAMSTARLTITDGTSIAAYWKATNTNVATRDWTIITNNNNFGDFAIRQGNSQGADATSGTDRLLFSATGAATFSSTLQAGTGTFLTTNTTPLIIQTTSGNCGMQMLTSSTTTNWLVAAQYSTANTFEITPSTAVGGTTFSTPALVVKSTGNVVIGDTTDNGAKLQVNGTTRSNGYQSYKGSVSIAAGGTAVIYTMSTDGVYYVYCRLNGGAQYYLASAIVTGLPSGGVSQISNTYNGSNVSINLSGNDIRITSGAYGTYTWQWSILYQPVD